MEKNIVKPLAFDVDSIRKDFPLLEREVNGKPLVYLDNGATAQKPRQVLDAIQDYYGFHNSNIHRGVHTISQEATSAFEDARDKSVEYFNANSREEIIFTGGTTDSINLLAATFGQHFIKEGDEIIITEMEHHSNIVPWQMICQRIRAKLKVIPVNEKGEIILEEFKKMLSGRTKLVAVAHVSNVLGTINPVKEIIDLSHQHNVPVLIDGAQAVPHMRVDFKELDCDFYAFSAHKMFGPTGIGMLYGKSHWLEQLPPYQGGGEMIKEVTFEKTTYNDLPYKFEAGTPNIAGGIGMVAAINYLDKLDFEAMHNHEQLLLNKAVEGLSTIEGIRFIGTAREKSGLVSFVVNGVHHYDIGMLLDKIGIAVRTGHNCTQPLMNRFGITGTVRASFAMYNTIEEIEQLIEGVHKAVKMLR